MLAPAMSVSDKRLPGGTAAKDQRNPRGAGPLSGSALPRPSRLTS